MIRTIEQGSLDMIINYWQLKNLVKILDPLGVQTVENDQVISGYEVETHKLYLLLMMN